MVIYAVDDEVNALEYLTTKLEAIKPDAEICAFQSAKEALTASEVKPFDVCFLDIHMPKVNGVALAKQFKEKNPKCNIIFVTGYSECMADAFALDASGYLLKPATKEQIKHVLENLRYPVSSEEGPLVVAQCFGNFELFYRGEPIRFKYNKSKEVLAYLIDRRGACCSNNEVICALWEDDDDHSSYYRSLQKDIHDTLRKINCEDIVLRQRAGAGIVPEKIRCDYYDFLAGKPIGINAYQGEYMMQYSWAETTGVNIYE